MSQAFEVQQQRYAELAINVGLNLQAGQRLAIRNANIDAAPMVRVLVETAYKAGASYVDVYWMDEVSKLLRHQHAPKGSFDYLPSWQADGITDAVMNADAILSLSANNPDLLLGQDAEQIATAMRVQREQLKAAQSKMMNTNWCIIGVPVLGWAQKVFPDHDDSAAMDALWQAIFNMTRVDQDSPIDLWTAHLERLTARKTHLTTKQYDALHYHSETTDLRLGLPKNHIWHGGAIKAKAGQAYVPNLPTEEVFTLPHKDRVDGVVTSSKPLSYGGQIIDEFRLTFKAGEVTEASAKQGQEALHKLLELDEGARRLGEAALVPHSSPVSQTGLLFYNTLYDENAACHLALGSAIKICLKDGMTLSKEEASAAGMNDSLTHVDFMIGSDKLDIDGITESGEREPLLRSGEWVID